MATSYYPLGSAAAKKAYQAVIGITGVERSNNLTSQLANAIKRNDNLFVKEAYVGKSIVLKRFRARAKGRASAIKKPFSNLTIILAENIIKEKELHGSKS